MFLAQEQLHQSERDRRKHDGGYKVGTNWFHSDDTSRIQQIALTIMGANMPANIMWKTMSGSFVLMTPTLAGQIFQAAAARHAWPVQYVLGRRRGPSRDFRARDHALHFRLDHHPADDLRRAAA